MGDSRAIPPVMTRLLLWILILYLPRSDGQTLYNNRETLTDGCQLLNNGHNVLWRFLPDFDCGDGTHCHYRCQKENNAGPQALGRYVSVWSSRFKMALMSAVVLRP